MSQTLLTLHHLPNSRSQRIVWLLEELGLPYELVIHRAAARSAQPIDSLLAVHPLGKVPILMIQTTQGTLALAESGAIVEYLLGLDSAGRLHASPGRADALADLYWRHFAEGSLMPYLAMKLVFGGIWQRTPWLLRPTVWPVVWTVRRVYLNPNLRRELDWIERHLHLLAWFGGEHFSAADVLMGFLLEAVVAGGLAKPESHPRICDFVARIKARPAYQQALQRGQWSAQQHARYWACLAH